jgi:hypothetical protein
MRRFTVVVTIMLCCVFFIQAENATAGCTRASLQAAAESYIAAQQAGDVSKMSLMSPLIKFMENFKEITKEQALFNTALPVAFHRNFLDADTCQTFTEAVITEGGKPYVLGTRLKVDSGKITEVNTIVTKEGDWLFNAANYLKYSSAEDWKALPQKDRPTRQALIDGANAYLDIFGDKNAVVPWGTPCARLEGGAYTVKDMNDPNASCNVGVPAGQLKIVSRDYLVDEELGSVDIFCRFGAVTGMVDSHLFRLINGKLRYVHTLSVNATPAGAMPKQAMPKAPTYSGN